MKKILSILLCVLFLIGLLPSAIQPAVDAVDTTLFPEFTSATSVPYSGTYAIKTADGLFALAAALSSSSGQYGINNNSMSGVTFYLANDIDLNPGYTFTYDAASGRTGVYKNSLLQCALDNAGNVFLDLYSQTAAVLNPEIRKWNSIGDYYYSKPFRGIFDGNGYTVKGLINTAVNKSNSPGGGLFGFSTGTITNVSIENGYIFYPELLNFAGGIVGLNRGTVTNCRNDCVVCGMGNTGGIVGYTDRESTVLNCLNTGVVYCVKHAGGIIGDIKTDTGLGTISGCINRGNVSAQYNASGIVGYVTKNAYINSCYNTGSVSITPNSNFMCAAGITSKLYDGTVLNCYNTGTITGYYAGGIVGALGGTINAGGIIKNCYNTGSINGYYAAGISSSVYDTCAVSNCYSIGIVSGTKAGGLFGNFRSVSGPITNCYWLYDPAVGSGIANAIGSGSTGGCTSFTEAQGKGTDDDTFKLHDRLNEWIGVQANLSSYETWYASSEENNGYPRYEKAVIALVSGYTGIYNGLSHGIAVNTVNPASGCTVYYATEKLTESNYQTVGREIPYTYTDVTDTAVYYYVKADGYYPATGKKNVTITPASMVMEANNYIGVYDGNPHQISVYVTTPSDGVMVYYSTKLLTAENYNQIGSLSPILFTDVTYTKVYFYITAVNYLPVAGSKTVRITSASSLISELPTAKAYYGTALADIPLEGGVTSVPGTWSWDEEDAASIIPRIDGTTAYTAVFTPENKNYENVYVGIIPEIKEICYNVSTVIGTGGTVTPWNVTVAEGSSVTVIVTPMEGYEVADVSVNGVSVGAVTSYIIRNIYEDQTVFVSFRKSSGISAIPGMAFADVLPGAWYYNAVQYVYNTRLMNGISQGLFNPEGTMTRAMLATVLWRMEGRPHSYTLPFGDVTAGQWYTEPISWAYESGVINGAGNGRFDHEGLLTREQVVSMLYRYLAAKGHDVGTSAELKGFGDAGEVSPYAAQAIRWAIGEGILPNIESGTLNPKTFATRAEVAEMLRLISLYM